MPTNQPVATRPQAVQINGTWYTYGWDLTKNICEMYSSSGAIATSYTYTPFGSVTASGSIAQPIQWSSEVWDSELGMVYYNWRYYDAIAGRWNNRDKLRERVDNNLYVYVKSGVLNFIDNLGLASVYAFSYKVTEQTERHGVDLLRSNIDEVAKNASEYTGKYIYEIVQGGALISNTGRPLQGFQYRYFIRFYCECDDGCFIFNIGATKPKIKTRNFLLTTGKLGISTQNGSAGFSAFIPVPRKEAQEFVNENIDDYVAKAKIRCVEECKKIK